MPETETAVTAYGEVQYETELCSYCGSKVMREEAIVVGLDTHNYTCNGVMICDATHQKPESKRFLCPYCADSIFDYQRGFLRSSLNYAARNKGRAMMFALIGGVGGAILAIYPVIGVFLITFIAVAGAVISMAPD